MRAEHTEDTGRLLRSVQQGGRCSAHHGPGRHRRPGLRVLVPGRLPASRRDALGSCGGASPDKQGPVGPQFSAPLSDGLAPPSGHGTVPRSRSSQVRARGPHGRADPRAGAGARGVVSPRVCPWVGRREVHTARPACPAEPLAAPAPGRSCSPGRPGPEWPQQEDRSLTNQPEASGLALTSHPPPSVLSANSITATALWSPESLSLPHGDRATNVRQARLVAGKSQVATWLSTTPW